MSQRRANRLAEEEELAKVLVLVYCEGFHGSSASLRYRSSLTSYSKDTLLLT